MKLHDINYVMSCPTARNWVGDDYCSSIDFIHPSHIYHGVKDNGLYVGFFLFIPKSHIEYDSHVCFRKEGLRLSFSCGKEAINSMRSVCKKLTCEIPENNKLCINYAKRLGFSIEGINKKSFMKNGRLIDKMHMGLEL